MKCKALKHKTLEGVYGVPNLEGDHFELYHASIPLLQPETATMEAMIEAYSSDKTWDNTIILEQIKEYELVTVEVEEFDEKVFYTKSYICKTHQDFNTAVQSDSEACFGHDKKSYVPEIRRIDARHINEFWVGKVYYLLHLH